VDGVEAGAPTAEKRASPWVALLLSVLGISVLVLAVLGVLHGRKARAQQPHAAATAAIVVGIGAIVVQVVGLGVFLVRELS
jgi:flagellar basal body-associated protein FliL